MSQYTIKGDEVLQGIQHNLERSPDWMPTIIRTHFLTLRTEVVDRMKEAVLENRYTGALEDSISGEFEDSGMELTISPKAMRAEWDAGTLLEMGTRPHAAPWAPIAAWSDFRGLPAFPVWYAILTRGTQPHPFLERTLEASESQILETGRRIVSDSAEAILFGTGKIGLA